MRVDIFCESGSQYGLGHFYRCLKLLAICATLPCVRAITLHNRGDFAPTSLEAFLPDSLFATESKHIESKHYEWLSTLPEMLDIAIVDSYEAQEWFYHRLTHHAKALICLDDTLRDVYPPKSYILNPTPHAMEHFASKIYKARGYHLWCGEAYMIMPILPILNNKMSDTSGVNEASENCLDSIKHIFVSFGGVDSTNLSQALLTQLDSMTLDSVIHFHIVLGAGYAFNLHIPTSLNAHTNIQVSIYKALAPYDFLNLAASCDYAISAGGGSMLELIALKIPSIIIESALNQHFQITQWAQKEAIYAADSISSALKTLRAWLAPNGQDTQIPTKKATQNIAQKAALERIEHTLLYISLGTKLPLALKHLICAKDTGALQAINFCDLNTNQSALVLSMRNHPQVARYMYMQAISQNAHNEFLAQLKSEKTKIYWLFQKDSEYIGVGSLSRINLAHKHAFIGIYANPLSQLSHKGAQILSFMESYAFGQLGLHTLHIEVLYDNERAIRFYTRMGYVEQGRLHHFIARKEGGKLVYSDVILMYKEHE
ncbi:UDP-4-amino-4,6-dideoxy-N-acetyl-beta-L-altrosamine N-acetyltransferase [Helicobacter jaachi]|uniref:UDP-4-amino-4, 6-dideoxy-N-acetyl-beta-L-altrosamine N-acetyltransferase n=1 Tax=Helicobacter jaachi TaxID=1677920 RepID=A0A4U8TDU4_9HELI|nr:UDP-4-amino-4,6-dideoxy-N-acetyl-beta-L-altrosamine N-acetyltransferase [Helicobacter jaachi]TLD96837.1 UDP-4-amino-4,6-dideoxy-N-acetyl-beta-L-altrosamine N-acetyltransferase [Helicobacter jaachi]